MSIGPFTQFVMIPTNFELIKRNEEKGGARSEESAKVMEKEGFQPGERSAEDSVNGVGERVSEMMDLSGPQEATKRRTTGQDDEEVRVLLERFKWLNWTRAVLIGGGGIVGCVIALS